MGICSRHRLPVIVSLVLVSLFYVCCGMGTCLAAEEKAKAQPVVIAFAGDFLPMHTSDPFAKVRHMLSTADITFLNLECPLSTRGKPTALKYVNGRLMHNEYIFRGSPGMVNHLDAAGVDVVSLANNHIMDYGPIALSDTIAGLSSKGISCAGAGSNMEQARTSAVVTRYGVRIAFLAYVSDETLPGRVRFEASSKSPGTVFVHARGPDARTDKMLKEDISAARSQADMVVVSYHWGLELHTRPSSWQRSLAHRTIDYGAHIVVGHHPHCLQGVEIYKGRPILYSMGNFVFRSRSPLTRRSAVAWLRLRGGRTEKLTYSGVWITGSTPGPPGMAEARRIAHQVTGASRELGSPAHVYMLNGYPVASIDLSVSAPRMTKPAGVMNKDLVDVKTVIPGISIDLRYAQTRNRYGIRLYDSDRCLLRRGTALKLRQAEAELSRSGLHLKIWDAYRPLSVQHKMWKLTRDRRYVANPKHGSNHNRGAAVDVTLVDSRGRDVPMPTDFDDFSVRARSDYPIKSTEVRRNRWLLRRAMISAGFRPLNTEWWHFDDSRAREYRIVRTPVMPFKDTRTTLEEIGQQ